MALGGGKDMEDMILRCEKVIKILGFGILGLSMFGLYFWDVGFTILLFWMCNLIFWIWELGVWIWDF